MMPWARSKGSLPARPGSDGPGSSSNDPMKGVFVQTEAPEFPWQYRMRVSPDKERRLRQGESLGSAYAAEKRRREAQEKLSREKAAQSRAAARLAEQRAQGQRALLEKTRAEAAARQRRATAQADAAAIAEAGRLAEAELSNPLTPIKDYAQLVQMRNEREATRAEVLAAHAASLNRREGSMKFKLTEAIQLTRKSIAKLMSEWDKNIHENQLTKLKFKQSVRLTLKLDATDPQIESLFDSLEGGVTGSVEVPALRKALRTLFEECIRVKEIEACLKQESDACAEQIEDLTECAQAAQEWETLNTKLTELHQLPPIQDRLGVMVDEKTKGFQREACDELAKRWGADDKGVINRDTFARQIMMIKNKGEFRIDGSKAEVDHQIDTMFSQLADQSGGRSGMHGESGDKVLDIRAAFVFLGNNVKAHKERESQVQSQVTSAEAKARSLQIAYLREKAKKDKQFDLIKAVNSDEAIAELLKKRHAEDDEEANIGNLSESQLAEMQQRANRSSRESTEGRTRASRSSRESADARSRRSRESVDGSRRASRESSDAPAPASLRASSTPGLGVAVETPVATSTAANSQATTTTTPAPEVLGVAPAPEPGTATQPPTTQPTTSSATAGSSQVAEGSQAPQPAVRSRDASPALAARSPQAQRASADAQLSV